MANISVNCFPLSRLKRHHSVSVLMRLENLNDSRAEMDGPPTQSNRFEKSNAKIGDYSVFRKCDNINIKLEGGESDGLGCVVESLMKNVETEYRRGKV